MLFLFISFYFILEDYSSEFFVYVVWFLFLFHFVGS